MKYVRFLLEEYAPAYNELAKKHADALWMAGSGDGKPTAQIRDIERELLEYQREFFG